LQLTTEGLALLKALDRDGVVAVPEESPTRRTLERLQEEGLVRVSGGEDAERRRLYVLSGRGVRLARSTALAAAG
jgi:DNA-binding PadR family transcriptional regulator